MRKTLVGFNNNSNSNNNNSIYNDIKYSTAEVARYSATGVPAIGNVGRVIRIEKIALLNHKQLPLQYLGRFCQVGCKTC